MLSPPNANPRSQTRRFEKDSADPRARQPASSRMLRSSTRRSSSFSANMSHELDTPLTAADPLQAASPRNPDGELTEQADRVRVDDPHRGRRPLSLIYDILDLPDRRREDGDPRPARSSERRSPRLRRRAFASVAEQKGPGVRRRGRRRRAGADLHRLTSAAAVLRT